MNTVAIVNSFMKVITAVVKLGEVESREFALGRGVPQGSKLGPVLFNVYTGDIEVSQSANQGSAKYADDFLFWSSAKFKPRLTKTVKKEVDGLKTKMGKWDIVINEDKTTLLVIGAENKAGRKIVKQLKNEGMELGGGKTIRARDTMKYLGIKINDDLNPKDAIDHAVSKAFAVFGKMKWLLRKKVTSMNVKRLIYRQLVRPTMLYGMSVCPVTTDKVLEKMGRCERKIIRSITGLHRREDKRSYPNKVLYAELGMKDTIEEQINKIKEKYEAKQECHCNDWYRQRMWELEESRMGWLLRNQEYMETTREWKRAKQGQRQEAIDE